MSKTITYPDSSFAEVPIDIAGADMIPSLADNLTRPSILNSPLRAKLKAPPDTSSNTLNASSCFTGVNN